MPASSELSPAEAARLAQAGAPPDLDLSLAWFRRALAAL